MDLTQEQKKLIMDNYPLVKSFIKKSIKKNRVPVYLIDDFISDTLWKFCVSALKFEEDMGCKFSTYAYGAFNFSLKDIQRKSNINKNKTEHIYDFDLEEEIKDSFVEGFFKEFIKECNLEEIESNILQDRFYHNLTFYDIGKKYGFSKRTAMIRVSKILKKINKKAIKKDLKMKDFYR